MPPRLLLLELRGRFFFRYELDGLRTPVRLSCPGDPPARPLELSLPRSRLEPKIKSLDVRTRPALALSSLSQRFEKARFSAFSALEREFRLRGGSTSSRSLSSERESFRFGIRRALDPGPNPSPVCLKNSSVVSRLRWRSCEVSASSFFLELERWRVGSCTRE